MSYERHMRCLRLIALVQIVIHHVTEPALSARRTCSVLKAVMDVDWKRLEGVRWLELLHYPNKEDICYVMRFFPSNETMTLQKGPGPRGPLPSPSFYKLRKDGEKRYMYDHDEKFYQVLDTDYATWALIHNCWEGRTGSWFIIALKKPTSEIPANIMARIQSSLAKAGQTKKFTWNRSRCMLQKTFKEDSRGKLTIDAQIIPDKKVPRDKLSLVDGLVPEQKVPRDKLSLVDGLVPDRNVPRDKLSLVDGLVPDKKVPYDKLSLVDGLVPDKKGLRDKLSLVDGLVPDKKGPRDKLSLVDGLVPEQKVPHDKLSLVDGLVPEQNVPRDKLSLVDGLVPDKKVPRDKLSLVDGLVQDNVK
nr:uncharacterized protein LOC129383184 [Dermacentor andersoni]